MLWGTPPSPDWSIFTGVLADLGGPTLAPNCNFARKKNGSHPPSDGAVGSGAGDVASGGAAGGGDVIVVVVVIVALVVVVVVIIVVVAVCVVVVIVVVVAVVVLLVVVLRGAPPSRICRYLHGFD